MELDEMKFLDEEVKFLDEELKEGFKNWKLTLIGCVRRTEVSWTNMDKFVKARWKEVNPPIVVNQNGVFLFQFHSPG